MEKRRRNVLKNQEKTEIKNDKDIEKIEEIKEEIKEKQDINIETNEQEKEDIKAEIKNNKEIEKIEQETEEDKNTNVKKGNKKTKNIIIMIIWICILLLILYQVVMLGLYTIGKVDKSNVPLYTFIDDLFTKYYPKYSETEEVYTVDITALGNIYTSYNIYRQYMNLNISESLKYLKEDLKESELVLANLKLNETRDATDEFNSKVIEEFKNIGVDIFTTSNENTFEKTESEINEMKNILKDKQVVQTGIVENEYKPYIYNQNNIKVGVISYYLNLDKENLAVVGKNKYINYFTEENLQKHINYLKENKVDFIIAYLDYSNDDTERVSKIQKEYAEKLLQNGINVVFQTGSIAIKETYEDIYLTSSGKQNHSYVMYSLGDIFGLYNLKYNTSTIGKITFTKKIIKNNLNEIEDKTISYMTVNNPEVYLTKKEGKNINIYPVTKFINEYNKDNSILDKKLVDELSLKHDKYSELLKFKTVAKNEEETEDIH